MEIISSPALINSVLAEIRTITYHKIKRISLYSLVLPSLWSVHLPKYSMVSQEKLVHSLKVFKVLRRIGNFKNLVNNDWKYFFINMSSPFYVLQSFLGTWDNNIWNKGNKYWRERFCKRKKYIFAIGKIKIITQITNSRFLSKNYNTKPTVWICFWIKLHENE